MLVSAIAVGIAVATLDCMVRISKEQLDMMETDEWNKERPFEAARSECNSSVCSSPVTPTSVLPQFMGSPRSGDYARLYLSSSLLQSLRAQAVGNLGLFDVKRLTFPRSPHTETMESGNFSHNSKDITEAVRETCSKCTENKNGSEEDMIFEMDVTSKLVAKNNADIGGEESRLGNSDAQSSNSGELKTRMVESSCIESLPSCLESTTSPMEVEEMPMSATSDLHSSQLQSQASPPLFLSEPVSLEQAKSGPVELPETSKFVDLEAESPLKPLPQVSRCLMPDPPPLPPLPRISTRLISATPLPPQPVPQITKEVISEPPSPPLPPVCTPNQMALPPPLPSLPPPHKALSPPPPPVPERRGPAKVVPVISLAVLPPPPPPFPTGNRNATAVPPPPPFPKGNGAATAVPPPPPFPNGNRNATAVPPPPPIPTGIGAATVVPPPPPIPKGNGAATAVPPPPPGSTRSLRPKKAQTKLKRSSQMGNLYRLLKGKVEGGNQDIKGQRGSKSSSTSSAGGKQGMADALAEMTKRSAYFQKIEEDTQKYADSIHKLKTAISAFQTKDMKELITFHRHVESILENLTDETQVLARFEGFPQKKLETLRMATALYSKLDEMRTELQKWKFEAPLGQLLDKVERYFNKIKGEIDALDRTKDEESKKFQAHNIHFDFEVLLQIKEAMVDVSSNCMEFALKERRNGTVDRETTDPKTNNKKTCAKMLWRAFQFAFRVYTFAGGHDDRADNLTRQLAHEIETDPQHQ